MVTPMMMIMMTTMMMVMMTTMMMVIVIRSISMMRINLLAFFLLDLLGDRRANLQQVLMKSFHGDDESMMLTILSTSDKCR